mmetsp:Transcript_1405/g.3078  ORF Transcript_1405/g.3078 Transcript_1405/m.3078 type:complete len:94 (+) Transcript_1405:512-793(+)
MPTFEGKGRSDAVAVADLSTSARNAAIPKQFTSANSQYGLDPAEPNGTPTPNNRHAIGYQPANSTTNGYTSDQSSSSARSAASSEGSQERTSD